jgi:hypothetical protein
MPVSVHEPVAMPFGPRSIQPIYPFTYGGPQTLPVPLAGRQWRLLIVGIVIGALLAVGAASGHT